MHHELILLVTALVLPIFSIIEFTLFKGIVKKALYITSVIIGATVLHSLFFESINWVSEVKVTVLGFKQQLIYGYLNIVMILVVSISIFSIPAFSSWYFKHKKESFNVSRYWALLPLLFSISLLLLMVNNFILFAALLEVIALIFVMLMITDKSSRKIRQTARFYLIVDIMSSTLLLMSFAIVYLRTGSTSFFAFKVLEADLSLYALLFAILGFMVKAGIFPFHWWLTRVHSEALSPLSAYASGFLSSLGVYGIVLILSVKPAMNYILSYIFITLGIASAIYGSIAAIVQHDIKKLIAYSTIAHNGYILLLIILAINTLTSYGANEAIHILMSILICSTLLYIFNHSVAKIILFLIAGYVEVVTGTRDFEKMGSLRKVTVLIYIITIIASIILIGLPPSLGFIVKSLAHISLLKVSLTFIADVSIAGLISLLTATYVMKFIYKIFFAKVTLRSKGFYKEVLTHKEITLVLAFVIPALSVIFPSLYTRVLERIYIASYKHLGGSLNLLDYLITYPFVALIISKPPLPPITFIEELAISVVSLATVPLLTFSALWVKLHIEQVSVFLHKIIDELYKKHVIDSLYVIKRVVVNAILRYEDNYILSILISAILLTLLMLTYLITY